MVTSGPLDHTVKLWNPTTGQYFATLNGHSDEVYAVAFLPDERLLVSGGSDFTVRVWEVGSRAARNL